MFTRLVIPLLVGIALLGTFLARPASGSTTGLFHDALLSHQIATAYTPDQIATAYDFSPLYNQNLDGSGETVALLEIDKYAPGDIATFDNRYGLPAPSIQQFYVGGKQFPLENHGETALDIEWLHALAPGAAIQLYYLDNAISEAAGWKAVASGLQTAANNGAGIVSISLAACQPNSSSRPVDSALATLFHHNISVFVSSGDSGDHAGSARDCGKSIGVAYPSGDPYVASVGGTSLYLHGNATILREIACRCSGGGRVRLLLRRPWQQALTMPSGRQRWAPDVAFLADEHTGVNYFFQGNWIQVGGTSLGAPTWAAAWALILQDAHAAGKIVHPAVKLFYRIGNSAEYSADFHDITVGSNGSYHAGPGWDPVTGWGTPKVAQIAATVMAWSAAR